MMQKDKPTGNHTFFQKTWIVGGIFALIVVLLLLIKTTFNVFLLVLAGILIAVFFLGLGSLIERKTKWNRNLSLAASIIITFLFVTLLFWLIGAKLQSQIVELTETLPTTIQQSKEQLNRTTLGQKIVKNIYSPETQQKAKALAATFFKTGFGVIVDIYVILFLGIFFMASPRLYKEGIVQLVPKQGQQKARVVLDKIGDSLKKWLKGKLFAMLVVFVLTAIGLLILGMPMWLALALIAGLLNFIPNFGPLIAMIPAVLVAFMQGPVTAGLVTGLYIIIQVVESNFITPLVQKKLIKVPPALIIIAQLLMGTLTGGWGILLATPFMVIIMIMVQQLYIKKQELAEN